MDEAEGLRQDLAALRKAIEAKGFEVMEGDYVLRDGTHTKFFVKPVSVRHLLENARMCCLGDHETYCCRIHGTHVSPHVGCILR